MTKEELKQEAEEYVCKRNPLVTKEWFIDAFKKYDKGEKVKYLKDCEIAEYEAYIAGAEPREKRIAELEEISTRLESYYQNQKVRISELEEAKANLEYLLEGRDNEIDELKKENKVLAQNLEDTEICENGWKNRVRELEAQIEKMKVKWHDLEKDPNDLPKDYKTLCICLSDFGSKYEPVPRVCVGYCDSLGWSDYMGSSLYSTVRYWCELPK